MNKLTWEDRIKWDVKWNSHFRTIVQEISMFIFRFNSDEHNPMQVFKDYKHIFHVVDILYGIDNDIGHWVRVGMSYHRFMELETRIAIARDFGICKHDIEDWKQWAIKGDLGSRIVAFLKFKQE